MSIGSIPKRDCGVKRNRKRQVALAKTNEVMTVNAPEILSEREVESIFGFSIPYLRRARRERRGPRFLKVGKLVRYRRADIEAYLTAHQVETADKPASQVSGLRA